MQSSLWQTKRLHMGCLERVTVCCAKSLIVTRDCFSGVTDFRNEPAAHQIFAATTTEDQSNSSASGNPADLLSEFVSSSNALLIFDTKRISSSESCSLDASSHKLNN